MGGTKTVVAFVELADPLADKEKIGGFEHPLGEQPQGETIGGGLSDRDEKDIFEGVDLMAKVMDNTHVWYNYMLEIRHGSPYQDNPTHNSEAQDAAGKEDCTALQLDTFVSLDRLEKACIELDMLIQSAKAQLSEIRSKNGTKNVKFMLYMFMDDCMLRREKIRRTIAARQLIDTRGTSTTQVNAADYGQDEVNRLQFANNQLHRTLTKVKSMRTYDVFSKTLQDSIVECIECKLQVHENEIEILKAGGPKSVEPVRSALRTIKERWGDLKRFSIYNFFMECKLHGQEWQYKSEEEMLAFLVSSSDHRIDGIISRDKDALFSRDLLVPSLAYDLLVENAELRKMCNTYQLKVMLMRKESTNKPQSESDWKK